MPFSDPVGALHGALHVDLYSDLFTNLYPGLSIDLYKKIYTRPVMILVVSSSTIPIMISMAVCIVSTEFCLPISHKCKVAKVAKAKRNNQEAGTVVEPSRSLALRGELSI